MFETEKKEQDFFKVRQKPKASVTFLYGDTSSGKTYVALSFPEPIYVIDTESRATTTKYHHYPDKDIMTAEPVELKTNFISEDDDVFDTYATIENISKIIIDFANKVKAGKIKKGTLVFDSVTDLWSWCQDWGVHELAKYTNKKGVKKADVITMSIEQQTDWKIINKKHYEMVGVLRSLINYGIFVVFTAREEKIPEYIQKQSPSTKDKIRCQKDIPFLSDNVFQLTRVEGETTRYLARCVKLSGLQPPAGYIENLTFEKMQSLVDVGTKKLVKREVIKDTVKFQETPQVKEKSVEVEESFF